MATSGFATLTLTKANHKILVKMDRARSVGSVKCNVCMEEFQTTINYLSETVDVYADWIDACEKANE